MNRGLCREQSGANWLIYVSVVPDKINCLRNARGIQKTAFVACVTPLAALAWKTRFRPADFARYNALSACSSKNSRVCCPSGIIDATPTLTVNIRDPSKTSRRSDTDFRMISEIFREPSASVSLRIRANSSPPRRTARSPGLRVASLNTSPTLIRHSSPAGCPN